jgi:hypothetical protein
MDSQEINLLQTREFNYHKQKAKNYFYTKNQFIHYRDFIGI